MDQCRRQSEFRFSDLGKRRRLYLARQQPIQPLNALEQRSGRRSLVGSNLYSRRTCGRCLVGDTATLGRRRRVCRTPWSRIYRFRSPGAEINQSLTVFTPPEEPVKIYQLRLHNSGRRSRRLTVLFFAEWVLGTTRDRTAPHLITQEDRETGALFATNAFHADEPTQIAFADINLRPRTLTADRREFLGRHGSLRRPAALEVGRLSGKVGPALDACAGLAATVVVAPQQHADIIIVIGAAANVDEARRLARDYREPARASAALESIRQFWDQALAAVAVETPDQSTQFFDESLASVSSAQLPDVGPVRVLSIGRRLWVPRSTPRRHGPGVFKAARNAAAPAPRRVAAVRRRRRPTLVASPARCRRPHALLRRLSMASLRGASLCQDDR